MTAEDATEYRSLAALINYVSQDRVDVGFCAKELSQRMSTPEYGDEL